MGWFFGYGSLVNHRTHDNHPLYPARLSGWRREWCLTIIRPVAFLSVKPAENSEIDGLVSQVPGGDWQALDAREYAYERQAVPIAAPEAVPSEVAVYRVAPQHRAPEPGGGILLSYLDVVVEGYQHHFGDTGIADFFATTDGWDRPVLNDRAAPKYPRHRDVGDRIRALTDHHLNGLAAVVKELNEP